MDVRCPIVFLCADGISSRAIYNALADEFGTIPVIMEEPLNRKEMFRRRLKKLGIWNAVGQVMFITMVVPILRRLGEGRVHEIHSEFGLRDDWNRAPITNVSSVNDEETAQNLIQLDPRIVIVNGTRIIGKKLLDRVSAKFINTHAGITPRYRGVHGGYWALVEGREDLVGTTVHFVDKGIDTGLVIRQAFFNISARDNFTTYPHLHTAHGISILMESIHACLEGRDNVASDPQQMISVLRYHPTIWEYLYYRLRYGIK